MGSFSRLGVGLLAASFFTWVTTTPNHAVEIPKPVINIPKPNIPRPVINIPRPNVTVNVPKPPVIVPKVDVPKPAIAVTVPKVDVTRPTVATPKIEVAKPNIAVITPKVNARTVDFPKVAVPRPTVGVTEPVNLPKVETPKSVGVLERPKVNPQRPIANDPAGVAPKSIGESTRPFLNTNPPRLTGGQTPKATGGPIGTNYQLGKSVVSSNALASTPDSTHSVNPSTSILYLHASANGERLSRSGPAKIIVTTTPATSEVRLPNGSFGKATINADGSITVSNNFGKVTLSKQQIAQVAAGNMSALAPLSGSSQSNRSTVLTPQSIAAGGNPLQTASTSTMGSAASATTLPRTPVQGAQPGQPYSYQSVIVGDGKTPAGTFAGSCAGDTCTAIFRGQEPPGGCQSQCLPGIYAYDQYHYTFVYTTATPGVTTTNYNLARALPSVQPNVPVPGINSAGSISAAFAGPPGNVLQGTGNTWQPGESAPHSTDLSVLSGITNTLSTIANAVVPQASADQNAQQPPSGWTQTASGLDSDMRHWTQYVDENGTSHRIYDAPAPVASGDPTDTPTGKGAGQNSNPLPAAAPPDSPTPPSQVQLGNGLTAKWDENAGQYVVPLSLNGAPVTATVNSDGTLNIPGQNGPMTLQAFQQAGGKLPGNSGTSIPPSQSAALAPPAATSVTSDTGNGMTQSGTTNQTPVIPTGAATNGDCGACNAPPAKDWDQQQANVNASRQQTQQQLQGTPQIYTDPQGNVMTINPDGSIKEILQRSGGTIEPPSKLFSTNTQVIQQRVQSGKLGNTGGQTNDGSGSGFEGIK